MSVLLSYWLVYAHDDKVDVQADEFAAAENFEANA